MDGSRTRRTPEGTGFGARGLSAFEDVRPAHYAAGRAGGALLLAASTAVMPGIGAHRWSLALGLALLVAPMMYVLERWASSRDLLWSQSGVDVATCVLVAHLVPQHWSTIAIIGSLVVTANLMHMRGPSYLGFQVALALGLGSVALVHDIDGALVPLTAMVVVSIPVAAYSEWLRSRDELAVSRIDAITQSVAALVWESDPRTGRLRHLMGPTELVTGHTHAEFASRYPADLVHHEDLTTLQAELPADGSRLERTIRIRHADGRWLWVREVVGRVVGADGVERHRAVAMDITDLAESGEELRRRAEQDPLTGLMNRAAIVDDIRNRLARGTPVGVLLMDLDGFKAVNDTMGHHVGDRVLTVQARRLDAVARRDDAVGRLGGDEFVVVSGAGDPEALVAVARRLAEALEQPISIDGEEVSCPASVGVSWSPEHGTSHDELMRRADEAMYRAKRGGLGVHAFTVEPTGLEARRRTRLGELATGLDGEMELWFQPIVDAQTLESVAVEGLARWRHPEEGVLAPVEFLDLVESSGLTARFDARMLELGVAHAARLHRAGTPLVVAVNVTQRGLADRSFVRRFREELEAAGVAPDWLAIEISERSVDEDQRAVLRTLAELREMGVGIALDDFGTGYSSLSRLRSLPITEIKIDRSFVAAMTSSPADEIIVRSTVEMAAQLGLGVVAEGVSDETTLQHLRRLGCARLQGFLFSEAVPYSSTEHRAL